MEIESKAALRVHNARLVDGVGPAAVADALLEAGADAPDQLRGRVRDGRQPSRDSRADIVPRITVRGQRADGAARRRGDEQAERACASGR
ncbi:hypothetical protein GCM10010191_03610 [Actinomadura vinacea]|uniref:Uncharacterized protein n=1 Tax=Actinomadura vinacea TaxID=115336 RepID=A0ABN3IB76_9ACTN